MNLLETAKQGLEALDWCIAEINRDSPASLNARAVIEPLSKAIEQAEKQEPVAYIEHHKGGDNLRWEEINHTYAKATPLYTAPPKREWVGLTDHDIHQLRQQGAHSVSDKEFRMIDAKLKEKNHVS